MNPACKLVKAHAPRRGLVPMLPGTWMDLAIDPGAHTGWALFAYEDGSLITCGGGEPPFETAIRRAVVELPQVYPRDPVPPNDLITLAFQAGRYAAAATSASAYNGVFFLNPHTWKGSMPKEVCNARVRAKLTPTELGVLEACGVPKGQMHNVLDAIGIGLFAFRGIKV